MPTNVEQLNALRERLQALVGNQELLEAQMAEKQDELNKLTQDLNAVRNEVVEVDEAIKDLSRETAPTQVVETGGTAPTPEEVVETGETAPTPEAVVETEETASTIRLFGINFKW